MSEEDEMVYCGTITFDVPVPLSALEPETVERFSFWPVTPLYASTPRGRALAGVRGDAESGWVPSFVWFGVLGAVEAIARRQQRGLEAGATFDSDQRGRGRLMVDAGGRFHNCQEDEQPEWHRTRACNCFPTPADSPTLFAVADITENERITVRPLRAGPFTDYAVVCEDHGDVACPTSEKEALFRREAHIVEEHTARPLPLGRTGAAQELPPAVLGHLQSAAAELRLARSYAAPLAIRHRDAAREYTRHAAAELHRLRPSDHIDGLLRLVAELLADTSADV